MNIKAFKKLHPNDIFELKLKDVQQNMEEFTLMTTKNVDFSTFDVLSITRADATPTYTQHKIRRKVDTQAVRIASEKARVIPWPHQR